MLAQLHTPLLMVMPNAELLITGAILGALYSMKAQMFALYAWIKARFIKSYTIDKENDSLFYVLNTYFNDKYKHKFKNIELSYPKVNDKTDPPTFEFNETMIQGWFYVKHGGKRMIVSFNTETGKDNPNNKKQTITITCLFSTKMVFSLIEEALLLELSKRTERHLTTIVVPAGVGVGGQLWLSSIPQKLSAIAGNNKRELQMHVEKFLNSKKMYTDRGLSYRLGVTLEGEPGCGKSALVAAIAYEYDLRLIYLNIAYMEDSDLIRVVANNSDISDDSKPTVFLMEELDAVFKGRENTTKTNVEKGVTMSTLLNVLNGTIQLNNAIVVMTTNHIELIDPALKRAGRLGDVVIHFDKPTQEEAEEQLELFYGTNAKLNNYNRELYNNADLRNICIVCDDVEKAIEMVNAGAKVNE